jgi:hypothetical protein
LGRAAGELDDYAIQRRFRPWLTTFPFANLNEQLIESYCGCSESLLLRLAGSFQDLIQTARGALELLQL